MRHIIISFCLMLTALSVEAAPIDGIHVESSGEPVLVFIDGQQMCTPTVSCFIANLRSGHYKVEVYGVQSSRRGDKARRGELLYEERVYYRGSGVKDIFVERVEHRPGRPGGGGGRPHREMAMNENSFNEFFKRFKSESFESGRMALLDNVLMTSYFSSEQCLDIVSIYTFDSERMKYMKKIYPRIADKQNFFIVIDKLTFGTSKTEMNDFVKQYH